MQKKKRRLPYWLPFVIPAVVLIAGYVVAHILKEIILANIFIIVCWAYFSFLSVFAFFRGMVRDLWYGLITYLFANYWLIWHFADVYARIGLLDEKGTIVHGKWVSLYFSMLAWAGASYGDLMPTPKARPWVAAETVLGYLTLAFLVSLIVLVVEKTRKHPKPKRPRRKSRFWRPSV